MARNSLTYLLTLFIFLTNFISIATGVKYLYIRYNPDEAFDGLPMPTGDTLNFYNFVMDSEALIYFIAAGWTCLTCIYSAAMLPCGWKGPLAAHIDFFITLISFCFQCGLGVMSAINTLLFEQNFMNLIAQSTQFNILQEFTITVAILFFISYLPIMGFLLMIKWEVFSRQVIQEDRFIREVKMVRA